jgi:hypothetical protein
VVLSRTAQYQQNLRNYHSRRVRPRSFEKGDLVEVDHRKHARKPYAIWGRRQCGSEDNSGKLGLT